MSHRTIEISFRPLDCRHSLDTYINPSLPLCQPIRPRPSPVAVLYLPLLDTVVVVVVVVVYKGCKQQDNRSSMTKLHSSTQSWKWRKATCTQSDCLQTYIQTQCTWKRAHTNNGTNDNTTTTTTTTTPRLLPLLPSPTCDGWYFQPCKPSLPS